MVFTLTVLDGAYLGWYTMLAAFWGSSPVTLSATFILVLLGPGASSGTGTAKGGQPLFCFSFIILPLFRLFCIFSPPLPGGGCDIGRKLEREVCCVGWGDERGAHHASVFNRPSPLVLSSLYFS